MWIIGSQDRNASDQACEPQPAVQLFSLKFISPYLVIYNTTKQIFRVQVELRKLVVELPHSKPQSAAAQRVVALHTAEMAYDPHNL
jgi:hypothetical protein